MKINLQSKTSRYLKRILPGILVMCLICMNQVSAQVSFTQTLNADFYKGAYNDLIVASDNVSLPLQATNVNTWLTTTILPQTLEGHKAATWNNRYVYIVGGYNDLTYSGEVYRATLQAGGISSWTTLNPLPVGLRDHAVVIGTNAIYVLGGRDDTNIYNTIYFAEINSDGSIGAWQTSSVSLPLNLWGLQAAYCNGYIYVSGGSNLNSSTAATNFVFYAKVLANNSLSTFSPTTILPATRNGHTMVRSGDKLYVLGGYANGGTKSSSVYFATSGNNGALGSWSTATSIPIAVSNHSSVIINGLITVLAGESGGTLSNSVYYADINTSPLSWNLATNVMYDRTKDGAAFAKDGWIGYCGGENLSGTPIHNSRYSNLSLSADYEKNGFFVSNPFYELGAERFITELTFAASNPAVSNSQIAYRTAGEDFIWDSWTSLSAISPISVGLTDRYLQYKVVFTSNGLVTPSLLDMNLWTPGTELAGNLNGITTFSVANSPYWVTADISFTSGTHTFGAGTELNFLPQTGMTVSQASIICNGTVADSVRFQGYTSEIGQWDGIYFDPNSDNGVSSQFYYTVIEGAGYGSWNANLYCNGTNEPLLMHCNLRGSDGHGLNLNSSHLSIEETFFGENTENGVYLNNSNPSFLNCEMSANDFAGIYLTSVASEPNFYTVISQGNTYAMYYPSPNYTILPPNGTGLTFTANTYNGICIEGGTVSDNSVWNSVSYDYVLLGNVFVAKNGSTSRLTIEPGNTIKTVAGAFIQIGSYTGYPGQGGELYAIGTADSLITFTSYNGAIGGWEGIYFHNYNDNNGGVSVMDYCVIENGNEYNMFCDQSSQPAIYNSIIRNAVLDGIRYNSSYGSVTNSEFSNFGRYPIYLTDWRASPTLSGNTYASKGINMIAIEGGDYTEDRTLYNDGIDYLVLNNIRLVKNGSFCTLHIEPGLDVNFSSGTSLQVGAYDGYPGQGGVLNAVGSAGNEITFKPYSGIAGDWEGIYFHDKSDDWGAVSTMTYCAVDKGNEYNVYTASTTQPSFDHCTFSNAIQYGIKEYQSSTQIHNSQFLNNGSYPIYYTDWTCNSHLEGNTYTGNTPNLIALSGGDYNLNRTFYNDGIEYHILNTIRLVTNGNFNTLTIEPGVSLNFNPGTRLQIGAYDGYPGQGGALVADGNADSLIVFKPYNNLMGGWEGIYFHDRSDSWSAVSSMKYCKIEKGNAYNILLESTVQPSEFENCEITDAVGNGMYFNNSSISVHNSSFTYNGGYGIYLDGTSSPTIGNTSAFTCNIFGNSGLFDVYNDGTSNVNARYNYWGTGDSAMIASRIYDKYDNTAKGIVFFGDFAQVPSIPSPTMILSGDVWYANTAMTQLDGAALEIFDFAGSPIANTTANASGHYAFSSIASGNYTMEITPSNSWAGVNSTDALLILRHFAHLDTLTGVELAAADVNVSQTVNGTDALFVMKRYSTMISSFPSGDWLYNTVNLNVNGNLVTNDFEMLCFGDVNASYNPAKKDEGSVWMISEGSQIITSYSDFDLSVSVKDYLSTGAISLGIIYPEEFIQVNDVEFANTNVNLIYTAGNGLLNIAWADLDAMTLNEGDELLMIHCTAKDLSNMQEPIILGLNENCEFADQTAQPISEVTLSSPELTTLAVGIQNNIENGLWLSNNYPNPFDGSTTIHYSIPQEGKVNLKVIDITGKTLAIPVNAVHRQGEYFIKFQADGLEAGIYFYQLEFTNEDLHQTIVNKMSVTR
ncbi:MAG: T9SS type A sorting domain-containing protein [Bacteroidales bacterium]|nr:T9SS type A sorting domain-containing protein [Bacteroidales bacterium]